MAYQHHFQFERRYFHELSSEQQQALMAEKLSPSVIGRQIPDYSSALCGCLFVMPERLEGQGSLHWFPCPSHYWVARPDVAPQAALFEDYDDD